MVQNTQVVGNGKPPSACMHAPCAAAGCFYPACASKEEKKTTNADIPSHVCILGQPFSFAEVTAASVIF